MPMLAAVASLRIVSTSHASASFDGDWITCAPVVHLAIDFDISSEMIAPVKPTTSEKTRSCPYAKPCAASAWSRPKSFSTTDSTTTTARLVARNRMIRFMGDPGLIVIPILALEGDNTSRRPSLRLPRSPVPARPRIAQRHRSVEHGTLRAVVDEIGDEIAVSLELDALLRQGRGQRRFHERGDHALRFGVQIVEERVLAILGGVRVFARHRDDVSWRRFTVRRTLAAGDARARERHPEQPIVEPHLGTLGMRDRQPVNVAFHLAGVGARGTAARRRIVRAAHA